MSRAATLLPCVFLLISSPAGAEPVRDPLAVDGGRIRGVDTDVPGVRAYKGIPFAAPPVGDRRWKPPQPVLPWEGVRECSQFGPACPQPDAGVVRTAGKQDEDCLYLNVWTAARSTGERRPVMVWIHGGGSTIGSASQPFCWIQFARTGNPNGPGLPEWPRYDAQTDRHLQFGDTIQTGTALHREACDLFERIARQQAGMPAQ